MHKYLRACALRDFATIYNRNSQMKRADNCAQCEGTVGNLHSQAQGRRERDSLRACERDTGCLKHFIVCVYDKWAGATWRAASIATSIGVNFKRRLYAAPYLPDTLAADPRAS